MASAKKWRIDPRVRRALIIAALVVIVLIVSYPMRLALSGSGMANGPMQIREARGSVWSGVLLDARMGPIALGHLDASLNPWSLLVGVPTLTISSYEAPQGSVLTGSARLRQYGDGFAIEDMTATLPVDAILAPAPVSGLRFEDFYVRFRDGRCLSSTGRVTMTLQPSANNLAIGNTLTGATRCSGERLLISLKGNGGTSLVDMYIDAKGGYRATLRLVGLGDIQPEIVQSLGFVESGGQWEMRLDGNF